MKAANATELYIGMHSAIAQEQWTRQVSDPESCQLGVTCEARPGAEFELQTPEYNVQICVPFIPRWALANALHFFAATEDASMLHHYTKAAAKYIVDGKWIGAYGAIAMPQVYDCIARLREYPNSRRAIVSMGDNSIQDMHRPACWSFLQFLQHRCGLCMLVYQRSLNLTKIMPYDLIVLSNLLLFVAREVYQEPGSLIWTIGSLHTTDLAPPNYTGFRHQSMRVPTSDCLTILNNPTNEVWK